MPERLDRVLNVRMKPSLYVQVTQLADEADYDRADLVRVLLEHGVQHPPSAVVRQIRERRAQLDAVS